MNTEEDVQAESFTNQNDELAIVERVIACGTFVLKTAAHLGGGRADLADMTISRGADGSFLVAGSTLAGVCRSYLAHYFLGAEAFGYLNPNEELAEESFWNNEKKATLDLTTLFGAIENSGNQSTLIFSDAYLAEPEQVNLTVRDGVRVDPATGQAALQEIEGAAVAGAKYDLEVIEPGARFNLKLELILRKRDSRNADLMKACLNLILDAFENEHIRVGARTKRGLGRGKVDDWRVLELNFSQPSALLYWLYHKLPGSDAPDRASTKYPTKLLSQQRAFKLTANFEAKSSLLVRSYNNEFPYDSDFQGVDATHIKSNGNPILPGSSVAGVLRHRAERIAKTLARGRENGNREAEQLINNLFGYVELNKTGNNDEVFQRVSRIRVEEEILEANNLQPEIFTRLSVDRFTGGSREGFLFKEEPLWSKVETEGSSVWTLELEIWQPDDAEIGLLLLALKDLWLGDLPIGGEVGIGRGTMRGLSATFELGMIDNTDYKKWVITTLNNSNSLRVSGADPSDLEGFVKNLKEKLIST